MSKIKVHFLGAAGTVTGSKFLIETSSSKILVDCGLFQGLKKLRLLNWEYLPVNASEVDHVLLTHGHLDHCGYLPRLVAAGFRGNILGTEPTLDIATIILNDSAKIQEEQADRANLEGFSKHKPAKPLYDLEDVKKTLPLFRPVPSSEWVDLGNDAKARFHNNGHIIGSCYIEMLVAGKTLIFSGDVGRDSDPLMNQPVKPEYGDFVFMESTYGNRIHPRNMAEQQLEQVINSTYEKGGTLIIPSFAVERSQLLMYLIWQLSIKKAIPDMSMIMDSPMGANVLKVFHKHPDWHKLSAKESQEMCDLFHIVKDYKETQAIIHDKKPKIVIAGSGMLSGGRVLGYLEKYISLPETTVLMVGFQAEGTRGRALLEGVQEVKFFGQYHPVKAKIELIDTLSAHAGQNELIGWLSSISNTPERIFLIHGEPQSSDAMRVRVQDTYGWDCEIPELFQIVEL